MNIFQLMAYNIKYSHIDYVNEEINTMIRKKISHLGKKIKTKAKAVLSRRNRSLFIKGFVIGVSATLFSALPVSAMDDIPLLPKNITRGSNNGTRSSKYVVENELGPQIVRDAKFHALHPSKEITKSSIAAAILSLMTTNSALYIGITSGLIIGVLVLKLQNKYLISRVRVKHVKK